MYPLLPVPLTDHLVSAYHALYATAALFAVVVGPRWIAAGSRLDVRAARRASAVLLVAALLGGRLHFVLASHDAFAAQPLRALAFWEGGRHVGGALLALLAALPFVVRRLRLPAGRYADAGVATVAVAIAIARVGCFLHGCCAGIPGACPWCVTFPRWTALFVRHAALGLVTATATRTAPVHPLPLYFAGASLLVGGAACWLLRRKRYDWQVVLVALTAYSALAAFLEGFRADYPERVYWGALPQLTWIALATTAGAGLILGVAEVAHRCGRRSATGQPSANTRLAFPERALSRPW